MTASLPETLTWRGQTLKDLKEMNPQVGVEYVGYVESSKISVYSWEPEPGLQRIWYANIGASGTAYEEGGWEAALEEALRRHKKVIASHEKFLQEARWLQEVLDPTFDPNPPPELPPLAPPKDSGER
jgi:hypothetical protein